MQRPRREYISESSLSLIGIPKTFHKADIESFKTYNSVALEKIKSFMMVYLETLPNNFENNHGIYFFGSNGVGKTMLACLVLKEAYICRYSAKRVTFVNYIEHYTRLWDSKSGEERDALEQEFYSNFKAVEFLVLEEIGKEIDTKISAPILEDCLRYREDKGLVTIICTNLQLKEIEARYGASCLSLMKGHMTPIKMEGSDKRPDSLKSKLEVL